MMNSNCQPNVRVQIWTGTFCLFVEALENQKKLHWIQFTSVHIMLPD